MTMSEHELREEWRRRSARAAANRTGCLTEDEFARLLSGEASTRERTHAAQHMATCASCAEEYTLLEPLRDWAGDAAKELAPGTPVPASVSAAASRSTAPHSTAPRSAGPLFSSSQSGWLLAAACVLIAVLGGGLWALQSWSRERVTRLEGTLVRYEQMIADMRTEAAKLHVELEAQRREQVSAATSPSVGSTPLIDVPIVDLEPLGSGGSRAPLVSKEGPAQVITARAAAPAVVLILNFPPLETRTMLRVEIVDDKGQTRWSGTTERPRQTASLNLTLPRQAFPPGSYHIRLTVSAKEGPTKGGPAKGPLAVYPIELR